MLEVTFGGCDGYLLPHLVQAVNSKCTGAVCLVL